MMNRVKAEAPFSASQINSFLQIKTKNNAKFNKTINGAIKPS